MVSLDDLFEHSVSLAGYPKGRILLGYGPTQKFQFFHQLNPKKPAFYIPDFFLRTPLPWVQHEHYAEIPISELNSLLDQEACFEEIHWKIGHQNLFYAACEELQKKIKEKLLSKAVPYVFAYTQQKMHTQRLINSIKRALSIIGNYSGHLYGHWDMHHGFLGVTPEILFYHSRSQPRVVQTMALAGTQKKQNNQNDFLCNEKERHEHQLVLNGIEESLKPIGHIKAKTTEVLKLPTLNHLFTPIEVSLHIPFFFPAIVEVMHPTPALGAFPKQSGMRWLMDYQAKLDRLNYGAPFGFYDELKGISLCLVAIRQVQWNSAGMRIGAGCGIVEKSVVNHEWEEIQLKIRAIRNMLAL